MGSNPRLVLPVWPCTAIEEQAKKGKGQVAGGVGWDIRIGPWDVLPQWFLVKGKSVLSMPTHQSTHGLVAMTSASHAEGRQFDPGWVYLCVCSARHKCQARMRAHWQTTRPHDSVTAIIRLWGKLACGCHGCVRHHAPGATREMENLFQSISGVYGLVA